MKSILFALLALTLGGCATTWPESASLNPQINDQPDNIYSGNTIAIDNQDTRLGSQIIKIKIKKDPEVLIPAVPRCRELYRCTGQICAVKRHRTRI